MEERCPWMAYSIEQVYTCTWEYFCKNLYLLPPSQVLKVIYWSRNGVLFNELLEVSHYTYFCRIMLNNPMSYSQITALSETLLRLTVCEFQRRSILHCCGGLLQLSHHDVYKCLSNTKISTKVLICMTALLGYVTFRCRMLFS